MSLPKGYVPIAHCVFDRIADRVSTQGIAAALDILGVRTPPAGPHTDASDPIAFLMEASTEVWTFSGVMVDVRARSYSYTWRSNHRDWDSNNAPISRSDRAEQIAPWGPFTHPSINTEQPGSVSEFMRAASAFWDRESEAELDRLFKDRSPLVGRIGGLEVAFAPVERDLFDALNIDDWATGRGTTEDGLVVYSIHGPGLGRQPSKAGRPSQLAPLVAAIRTLRPDGDYSNHQKLKHEVAQFVGRKEIPTSTFTKAIKEARECSK